MITLSKIAKLANVSVSTASKAFSGSTEVHEETRQKVFEIAKQYGCFKKYFNSKYPKFVIAVICPEFISAHYASYLFNLQKKLAEQNCEVCVATTLFSKQTEKELIDYYYRYSNVDGVVVIGPHDTYAQCSELPMVFIHSSHTPPHGTCVKSDIEPLIREAIEYAYQNGVRSFGYVGETLTEGKLQAVQRVLGEKGIALTDADVAVVEERFEQGGYCAMEKLLDSRQTPPRAVICAYDNMAIGAMKCIRDRGFSIPEDIAVMGMDDIPTAAYLDPPLSSISANVEATCTIAADAMIKLLGGEAVDKYYTVPSEFSLRCSFTFE